MGREEQKFPSLNSVRFDYMSTPKKPATRKSKKTYIIHGKEFDAKAYKSALSRLKKAGLISAKADVRGAKEPTKHYRGVINKYWDYLTGDAKVVSVGPAMRSKFKEAGYRTTSKKAVIPKKANEKVVLTKEGYKITKTMANGEIETERVFIGARDLVSRLENMRNDPRYKNLGRGTVLGLRFNGFHSQNFFSNIDQLIQYFMRYDVVARAESNDEEYENDVYRNLEIVKIKRDQEKEFRSEGKRIREEAKRERGNDAFNAYRRRAYQDRTLQQRINKLESDKDYRKNIYADPEKREAYRRAARERKARNKG